MLEGEWFWIAMVVTTAVLVAVFRDIPAIAGTVIGASVGVVAWPILGTDFDDLPRNLATSVAGLGAIGAVAGALVPWRHGRRPDRAAIVLGWASAVAVAGAVIGTVLWLRPLTVEAAIAQGALGRAGVTACVGGLAGLAIGDVVAAGAPAPGRVQRWLLVALAVLIVPVAVGAVVVAVQVPLGPPMLELTRAERLAHGLRGVGWAALGGMAVVTTWWLASPLDLLRREVRR